MRLLVKFNLFQVTLMTCGNGMEAIGLGWLKEQGYTPKGITEQRE